MVRLNTRRRLAKRLTKQWNIVLAAVFIFSLSGCGYEEAENLTEEATEKLWQEAQTTPLGKYPELVTYTIGKLGTPNRSGMPEEDTYEDNNYTRYLRRILNIQNKDIFELANVEEYQEKLKILIGEKNLPDVMLVTDKTLLDRMVEEDLLEDLSQAYEQCTSDRIKDMYRSYGDDFLKEYTYDGRLMAMPDAEVDYGTSMLWLRKDWMDQLGLAEPETPEEAYEIIRIFAEENPGECPEGNVGLAFSLPGKMSSDSTFSLQPVFNTRNAFPGVWVEDADGQFVYGSVTSDTRDALELANRLYTNGVLDSGFMLRTSENILNLMNNGACGAVCGLWWLPYGYLQGSRESQGADWQPYVLCEEDHFVRTPSSYERISCVVVRKGYEHPEVVPKILTAFYDYAGNAGSETAEEVNAYRSMAVRPEALPLTINVDYKDALFRCTENVKAALSGEVSGWSEVGPDQLIAEKCRNYLEGDQKDIYAWTTYRARITAVEKLAQVKIEYVNEDDSMTRNIKIPDELIRREEEIFIQVITGEKGLESFDEFVAEWYENGGEALTKEVNSLKDQSGDGKSFK